MRKIYKSILAVAACALMTVSVCSVAGCSPNIQLDGDYSSGEVISNGGFVVEKGNYIYFINGQEDYTADNKGEVVKGALMRISVSDFRAGSYDKCETVVPYLMVAGDYDAGIYIYGDRVYYATPTNTKSTSGTIQNSYLDFKSSKLDGSDTSDSYYFRASDNTADYRFVEVDGVVYCLHVTDSKNVYSYNTQTGEDTLIVKDAASVFFDMSSSTSATFYYTMTVTVDIDSANSYTESYNQIYMATADMKADEFSPDTYSYTVNGKTFSFDGDYLEDNDDDFDKDDITTYPYVNMGTLIMDGKGKNNDITVYNADYGTTAENGVDGQCYTPSGYLYTIVKAENGGIYYTRDYIDATLSTGDGGWLFYTSAADFTSDGWNAITGNYHGASDEKTDVIALDTTTASASALFYIDESGKHCYIYADTEGNAIYRVEVGELTKKIDENDNETLELDTSAVRIVRYASSPTLMSLSSDGENYLYYSVAATNGYYLNRVVYDKDQSVYNALKDKANADYQSVQISYVDYTSDWYAPEIIENKLIFANAESIGALAYNYIYVLDMNGENGLITNSEIAARNEIYEAYTEVYDKVSDKDEGLGNLMQYYFLSNAFTLPVPDEDDYDDYYYSGTTNFYDSLLAYLVEDGYATTDSTYGYSQTIQDEFAALIAHSKGTIADYTFTDENGNYYGMQSYFYSFMGAMSDEDIDSILNVYKGFVNTYEQDTSWEAWQWVVFGVSLGAGVIILALLAFFIIRHFVKKRKARLAAIESAKPGRRHRNIDTTDDKSIDVYATEDESGADGAPAEGEPEEGPASTEGESEEADGAAEEAEAPAADGEKTE